MRALVPIVLAIVLAVVLLSGCAELSRPAPAEIAARTPVIPEHRSTCEALGRVDLAAVSPAPTTRDRSARALLVAAVRAPAAVGPAMYELAGSYRKGVEAVREDSRRSVVVDWLNRHCGGSR